MVNRLRRKLTIRSRGDVVMIGPFPPPTHGMANVNAAVRHRLLHGSAKVRVVDIAASSLDRGLARRARRLPKVLSALLRFATSRGVTGGVLYMSISGGFGQAYEILFLSVARIRRMRCVLHHHCFAYLDEPTRLAATLMRLAGSDSLNVVQSREMKRKLCETYRSVRRVMTLSNAALILECDDNRVKARESLHTIGLLSNLSEEKGVMEFLDLCQILQTEGLAVRAKLAGPFQDKQIESRVRARLAHLANTEYVGPRRGAEKDEFYRGIDAFVFPTRYRNETEPLVILESLHNGVPVIAFGRGTIPELIDDSCGHVIAVGSDFVTEAERCIRRWLEHPASFSASSRASRRRFESIYSAARDARERLLSLLTGTPYRGAVLDDRARDEAAQ